MLIELGSTAEQAPDPLPDAIKKKQSEKKAVFATRPLSPFSDAPRALSDSVGHPSNSPPDTWGSLPHKHQLALLALCRLASPLSQNYILPYLYYLLKWLALTAATTNSDSGKDALALSRKSGLLVAAFPLGQFATSMLWARLSDRFGRRKVVLACLFMTILSNIFFAFSRTFNGLLLWRVVAGMANGNIGVMRAMTMEIVSDRKHQTRAILTTPIVIKIGTAVALATGGCLADPIHTYPGLLTQDVRAAQWMSVYPYALPALVSAAFLVPVLLLVALGLKETHPSGSQRKTLGGRVSSTWLFRGRRTWRYRRLSAQENLEEGHHTFQSLKKEDSIWTRSVLTTLISFALFPLHNAAFMHAFPLFLCNPISREPSTSYVSFIGGLGLPPQAVGLWMSFIAFCGIILQLFLYPCMQSRFGACRCLQMALLMFPIVYFASPFLSLLSTRQLWHWPCIAIISGVQALARTIAMPSTVLLLTDASPHKRNLGRIHSAGNMAASLAKAIGPATAGWMFAQGIEMGIIGAVWWMFMTPVAIFAFLWTFFPASIP